MRAKAVLGSLAAVLVLALPLTAHAQWRGARHHGAWGRPLITIMLRHQQDLGLSPAQVAKLEGLRTDFMRDAIRREADIKLARLDLATLLHPDPADPGKPVDVAKADAKIHQIATMRADLAAARLRAIEAAKAELSPEQRSKLTSLLARPWGPRPQGERPAPPAGR